MEEDKIFLLLIVIVFHSERRGVNKLDNNPNYLYQMVALLQFSEY